MASLAAARAWSLRNDATLARPALLAAWGGALFILSDSLLAWDRFGGGLPLSPLLVLASYYAALWCIDRSVGVRASSEESRGGKVGFVRVDRGGRRIIIKQRRQHNNKHNNLK